MDLAELLARAQAALAERAAAEQAATAALLGLRERVDGGDETAAADVTAAIEARDAAAAATRTAQDQVRELEQVVARDAELRELGATATRTAGADVSARAQGALPAYDAVLRTGAVREERTYAAHREPGFSQATGGFRRGAPVGIGFQQDVVSACLGDAAAAERLARHRAEEIVERGAGYQSRAVGTGAFAGLTVPQYLTDMWAPKAAARRPFADAMTRHSLPETGMTAYISQITTGTSVDDQASEGAAATEQDIDDTLLSVGLRTASGQQTISIQGLERGVGTQDVILDDLYRRYATNVGSKVLTAATHGLTNVATSITYTDASPTVAELLPKIPQAASAVETALLDNATGDLVAVMSPRRWWWITQGTSTSSPIIAQPQGLTANLGEDYQLTYGRGVRGMLPGGIPVIVDANVPTNLGAGTNEDEIYIVDRSECHLWEDPAAPMFIRAEQTKAATLQVLLVVYGFYAFTHARLPHAQKITGTGLVTPTWTGV